ncbi:MAG: hypothetical protein DRN91_00125 [Candidatus Alkanophagales archaeon]|nr:MAG: hypothetical protein DRN91_00125 [Candidatus Alkanophagales archaeon]
MYFVEKYNEAACVGCGRCVTPVWRGLTLGMLWA